MMPNSVVSSQPTWNASSGISASSWHGTKVERQLTHPRKEQRRMATKAGTRTQAVLYARVSSKDQEREGFSIPAQQKLLREYARAQKLTVLREFVDVETAKQAGRSQFGEMLAFLKANPTCRMILVEKTDRLYRNIKDW